MAKMSRTKLQQIIKRDAPGFKIVKEHVSDAAAPRRALPDAVSPELEQIRRKYGLPESTPKSDAVRIRSAQTQTKSVGKKGLDDEIVLIEPKTRPTDTWGGGPGPKAVVVSGSQGRIIGRQG